MNRYSRFGIALVLALAAQPARAQEKFEPIPPSVAAQYHFNFARNFFASPEAEKASRKGVYAELAELEKLKGKVTSSPTNLLRALDLNDKSTADLMRHAIYLYLRYATNTKDTESNEAESKLFADQTTRTSFLQQELMNISASKFDAMAASLPALKKYAFVVESARRLKPHTLSLKEEELLGTLSPQINDWPGEIYQKALDETPWAKLQTPGGEIDVHKQEGAWRNSNDRTVRAQGFKDLYAGYARERDIYAYTFGKLVKAHDQVSQLRHYKNYPAETHFGLYLSTPEVKSLFERIAQQGDFNKRYQRLRADYIKKITGYDDVNVWDMTVVPPGMERPRFTIADASRDIEGALAPFGPAYAKELSALLNPANGRLDLAPGDNRVPGAFAWGFPGSQISVFYSYNFEGYASDVSAMAHEAGHAVHFQFMGQNHVPPSYTQGQIYFTESFAMFNELLFADYEYRQAKKAADADPSSKEKRFRETYFLEQFLNQAMAGFGITRQAHIEQAVYDGVEAGKLKTADDFDKLAGQIGSRYSIWFDKHPELRMEWIDVHHFYTQPMYYVNYVYANFLAMKYYELYMRDTKGFTPKYLALVRNGFNAPPSALLKDFLNIDLKDPKLISDALAILDTRIKALEALYAQQ